MCYFHSVYFLSGLDAKNPNNTILCVSVLLHGIVQHMVFPLPLNYHMVYQMDLPMDLMDDKTVLEPQNGVSLMLSEPNKTYT